MALLLLVASALLLSAAAGPLPWDEVPDQWSIFCPRVLSAGPQGVACSAEEARRSAMAAAISEVVDNFRREGRLPSLYRGWLFAVVLARLGLAGPYVEVGVKAGSFGANFLRHLRNLRNLTSSPPRYYLVDSWRGIENSTSGVHVGDVSQRNHMIAAIRALTRYWRYVTFLQLSSEEAAPVFSDGSIGFVYIDARHDYCGVMQDLNIYWPKLVSGGLLGGDDWYKTPAYMVCDNGSVIPGGVQQAVIDFAAERDLPLFVFKTQWLLQKPKKLSIL
mmetsp:Transcript_70250/g.217272  ORF Transcript_70250/g.217272 Transcript_70250/m.217272 type:complete len:275 (+) Transcript_70250:80-904(+)